MRFHYVILRHVTENIVECRRSLSRIPCIVAIASRLDCAYCRIALQDARKVDPCNIAL